MTVVFRRARKTDLAKIVAIFNESVSLPINDEVELVTPESRRKWLNAFDDEHPLWVAVDDNEVVAWCGLEPFYPHPAYRASAEISIYVSKSAQQQGIGRRFLALVDQWARTHAATKTIVAYIYQGNKASQRLFASSGFEYWGTLHNIAMLNGKLHSLLIYGQTY
ncbi:MAG: GNAT family N-acetyltransferase [Limosilactobacillus sp.]